MENTVKDLIISEQTNIIDAMSLIDKAGKGIAFVCNSDQILLATLSDGDIRRYIIQNGDLLGLASSIANYEFTALSICEKKKAEKIIQTKKMTCLPLIDADGKLVSAYFWDKTEVTQKKKKLNTPVVIQAGGKGTRLYPYTKILPKALVPIGERTITEHIMQRFLPYFCDAFFMIVHHKKNMIKSYFSDISTKYNITFIDEPIPLGTGGGLLLLKDKIDSTFFFSNCDILIDEDYQQIYDLHKKQGNMITMVCAMKQTIIPYGAVDINNQGEIIAMHEKPKVSYMANTGFYLLEPTIFQYIPENQFIHITDVIQKCLDQGEKVGVYPVSEYQWSDMGQLQELEELREKLDVL